VARRFGTECKVGAFALYELHARLCPVLGLLLLPYRSKCAGCKCAGRECEIAPYQDIINPVSSGIRAGVILRLRGRAELGRDAVPSRTEQLAVDCSWRQYPLYAGGTLRLHLCGPEGGKITHRFAPRSCLSPPAS
jgi:hypothetical protein